MISKPHRQEALSIAYLQAVAATCGMTWARASHDYGIDITLNEVKRVEGKTIETGVKLDIQGKPEFSTRFEWPTG